MTLARSRASQSPLMAEANTGSHHDAALPPPPPEHPFDDPSADTIIRSADGFEFRVFAVILSLASSVFADMFSLPQHPSASSATLNSIALAEDSRTVEMMLQLCYPCGDPDITALKDVNRMLEMADKYRMPRMQERMRRILVRVPFLKKEPLRVYAIAYRWQLEPEVRLAARHTLAYAMPLPYVEELEPLPAVALHRLWTYHKSCSNAARQTTDTSFGNSLICVYSKECRRASWFGPYMKSAGACVAERPCGQDITDPKVLAPAIKGVDEETYVKWCNWIKTELSDAIEKATSGVELEVRF